MRRTKLLAARLTASLAVSFTLVSMPVIPVAAEDLQLSPQQLQELKQLESGQPLSGQASDQAPAASSGQTATPSANSTHISPVGDKANTKQAMQGKVARSMVSLGEIKRISDTLSTEMSSLTKFLEDKMVDVSYPVLLPAISDNPITIATPNLAIYGGHFAEKRTKYVVNSLVNIGSLVEEMSTDVQSVDIPKDKAEALQPLVSDAEDTMKTVVSDYNKIASQGGSGKTFDAEQAAAKLVDMRRFLTTIDNDLKAIFRIINMQNATPELVAVVTQLRLLDRDAHWLGVIAKYLHDNATELDPLDAMVTDAQNNGWLVMGPSTKDFARIQHSPYIELKTKDINKRMTELSEYIKAVNDNMQALKVPAQKVPQVQPVLDDLTTMMADVNTRYQTLQTAIATGNLVGQRKTIADQAEGIYKDMEQADTLGQKIAQQLLGDNSVM